MKNVINMLLVFSLLLILAACGESENSIEDTNNASGENNVEENAMDNNELNENEEEESNTGEENNTDTNEENVNESENNNNIEENEPVVEENNTNDNNNDQADNNTVADENSNTEETSSEASEEVSTLDSVTLFFSDDQLLETFRVNSGTSVSMDESGAEQAMSLWLAGPSQDGLVKLLPDGVTVQSVEFKDNVAYVSFSPDIEDTNLGSSGELMFTQQVALMMNQFGYDSTMILINGEEVGELLGHMNFSEPISAGNPEDYEQMN